MNITVTGGTGFVGRRLVRKLLSDGHLLHLLVRRGRTGLDARLACSIWEATEMDPPAEGLEGADVIIHLAGDPAAQRWTPEAKRRIRDSRVDGTRRLVQAIAGFPRRPQTLICASAVGYYGSRGDEVVTESSPPGEGFLPEVCIEWEKAARLAEALGVRVVNLRIGIVLGPEGGVLSRVLPVFRLGLGGRLGGGHQWMSWIHIDDLVNLIRFALEKPELSGPVNATAPEPVTNSGFTDALAGVLRRPAVFTVPAFALKLLFGEMSEVLLGGQRVLPRAAETAGFRFEHTSIRPALENLLV